MTAVVLTEENTSRTVTTKDWTLHYNEAGKGHPVIFLHGSGPGATGWSNFSANIPALAEHYRVLAVDMPGWGRSDTVEGEERDHTAVAIQFLDELGIEKAAFVGNSMGGMTALRLAALHPDRVSHLVTMGAPAGKGGPCLFGPGDGPSEGLKVLVRGYAEPTEATMAELVDVMTFHSGPDREELARARAAAAQARPDHLKNFLEYLQRTHQVGTSATDSEIAAISAPALLIHGRDDRVVHFENSLRLVSTIRDSRLVLLNRCGHWAQLEHASEFNRLVADFIDQH
ncbi:alpha/beta fold hydrolase [Streptomyces sp. NBC_01728]|uniref:alpha/beta fold hydrolase n=1 Tax=unclassified Streptomyces TaxID=2593676 RepID=UPI002254E7E4|nr:MULTISPECIES: alpha/beta hydrolase [unclassified Streptomyces]MCX4457416.1 alpha/beta fold hydrolase [Streptomyces sp. NBC_01719]MCX4496773.1 alpha/beta fold hydrolase [Streptomyces sp. NBC_01728]MCX4588641.1 alpha/beta fold hydrolase [Streptomyces sp. NBC_01549]